MKLLLTAAIAMAGVFASAQSWDRDRDGYRGNDRDRHHRRDRDRDGRDDRFERRATQARINALEAQIRNIRRDRRMSRWEKERRIDNLQDEIRRLRIRARW
jgi:hypothetical protein